MYCEKYCGFQLKSISGSIFVVRLVEDDFKTTTVEFTELVKDFTTENVILSSDKTIQEMENFRLDHEPYDIFHDYSSGRIVHFETVEFLQRKIFKKHQYF